METKSHDIELVQQNRELSAKKMKNARGARRRYWQDQIAMCDRILALPRSIHVSGGPTGDVVEREVALERPRDALGGFGFKIGDIVQLKSGGHAMMVTLADCCSVEVIYSHKGELKTCDLSMPCLQSYDPSDDPDRPDIPF